VEVTDKCPSVQSTIVLSVDICGGSDLVHSTIVLSIDICGGSD